MPSILKVDQIVTVDDSSSITVAGVASATNRPCAELAYAASGGAAITMAANNSTTIVPFTRTVLSNQISANSATSSWIHAQTGIYQLILTYRQESGGDIWTQYAVRKNTPSALAGTSVRSGTNNGGHPAHWTFLYSVDSTTASYSLYGWANGTIVTRQTLDSVSSAWSAQTSDVIKIIIEKVS